MIQEQERPQWVSGRAPLEQVELATAFDVYVSAVKISDSQLAKQYPQVGEAETRGIAHFPYYIVIGTMGNKPFL